MLIIKYFAAHICVVHVQNYIQHANLLGSYTYSLLHLQVDHEHGVNLFYWFFESRSQPSKDPLVVWLTGGPGCSSMLAALVENGPFLIPEGKTEPVHNPYGEDGCVLHEVAQLS